MCQADGTLPGFEGKRGKKWTYKTQLLYKDCSERPITAVHNANPKFHARGSLQIFCIHDVND